MTKELYIIRHGETIENVENVIQGQLDGELTEKGKKQLYDLGVKFQEIPLELIIRSEMGRVIESTQNFLKSYGREVPVVECSYLNERYWGKLQGKKVMETGLAKLLINPDPRKQITGAELFKIDPGVVPFDEVEYIETIEPLADFRKRGEFFWYDFLPKRKEEKIAIIGHDWMHSNMLNVLFEEEPQLHTLGNGCFHYLKIRYDGKKPKIINYNLNRSDIK